MSTAPGKYDEIAETLLRSSHGDCVLVAVLNGEHGSGFSVVSKSQMSAQSLAVVLRDIAGQIEALGAVRLQRVYDMNMSTPANARELAAFERYECCIVGHPASHWRYLSRAPFQD
jgi:hypothetical protein